MRVFRALSNSFAIEELSSACTVGKQVRDTRRMVSYFPFCSEAYSFVLLSFTGVIAAKAILGCSNQCGCVLSRLRQTTGLLQRSCGDSSTACFFLCRSPAAATLRLCSQWPHVAPSSPLRKLRYLHATFLLCDSQCSWQTACDKILGWEKIMRRTLKQLGKFGLGKSISVKNEWFASIYPSPTCKATLGSGPFDLR